jgi:hypothetical protein
MMMKRITLAVLLALMAFTATGVAWADSDPSTAGPVSTEAP